jgi:hypothetical protein
MKLKLLTLILAFNILQIPDLFGQGGGFIGPRRQIQTDAYDNRGSDFFSGIYSRHAGTGAGAILPRVVYPYLPSGDAIQNLTANNVSSAPDIGAVEATIVFLANAFQARSGSGGPSASGIWIWRLAVYMCFFGILLSSYLIWQAVMQGKKSPGEGLITMLTKVIVVVALITFIVPNVPPMLIGICDRMTSQIDDWFTGGSGADGRQLVKTTFNLKMGQGQSAALAVAARLTGAIRDGMPDDRGARIIDRIQNDRAINDALGGNYSQQWRQVEMIYDRATGRSGAAVSGASIKDINAQIALSAVSLATTVAERIKFHVDREIGIGTAAGAAAPGSKTAGDEEIKNQIGRSLEGIDFSGLVYPGRILATYAYTAFIYLAISIWGMGFGALVWTALYSMPEEWNLGGVLFAGFKGGIAVVLGMALVTIYIAGGVHWSDAEATASVARNSGNWVRYLGAVASWFSIPGIAVGTYDLLSTATSVASSPGAFISKVFGEYMGMTPDQFIIGMLIVSAPAQAAMLVKGGNGIAESAKNALNAQGASTGSIGAMMGNWGGSAGVNASGGGDSKAIYNRRETSFMRPAKG